MSAKIHLTIPISMPNVDKTKTDVKPGVHVIDDSILAHWFVQALIGEGKIKVLEKIQDDVQVTVEEIPSVKVEEVVQVSEETTATEAPVTEAPAEEAKVVIKKRTKRTS